MGACGDQRSIVCVVGHFLSFWDEFFTEPGACWFSYAAWPLSFWDCLSLSTDAVVSDFLPWQALKMGPGAPDVGPQAGTVGALHIEPSPQL